MLVTQLHIASAFILNMTPSAKNREILKFKTSFTKDQISKRSQGKFDNIDYYLLVTHGSLKLITKKEEAEKMFKTNVYCLAYNMCYVCKWYIKKCKCTLS